MSRAAKIEDLFPSETHDPGGKVSTKLPAGMRGDAEFAGRNSEYRLWLSRWWASGFSYALWIGMNPSTASAIVNDPTISREIAYTMRHLGVDGLMKVNVMDYRVTESAELLKAAVAVRSAENLPTILRLASGATKIVVCYGALPKQLQGYADETVEALLSQGHQLWCLGLTKGRQSAEDGNVFVDRNPRHPLYVKGATELQPFREKLAA